MYHNQTIIHDLTEFNMPEEYYSISLPKLEITKALKAAIESQGKSLRQVAKEMDMKHPQIIRVTSGENYRIETLLKILWHLNLEMKIIPKGENKDEVY